MLSGLSDGAVTTRMRPVTRDAHLSFGGVRVAMPRPAHTSLDLGMPAHAVETPGPMTIRCLAQNCPDCLYEAYLTAKDPAREARRLGWHYVRARHAWICPGCWHALTRYRHE